jgi:signal transduction histidine kinase
VEMKGQMTSWIELVTEIEESADIAVTVLNDLINYDKISMGMLKLELTDITIVAAALTVLQPFHVEAKAKKITLRHTLVDEEQLRGVVVVGDSVKVMQIIRNLVANAIKFTPEQGTVTLSGIGVKFALSLACRCLFVCLFVYRIGGSCCVFCCSGVVRRNYSGFFF